MKNLLFAVLIVVALAGCASDEAFEQSPAYSSDSLRNTADTAAARDASSHGGFNPGQQPAPEGSNNR